MSEINFKINTDKITSLLYKALDTLMMKRPEKTSYGVIIGAILANSKEAICSLLSEKYSNFLLKINGFTLFLIGVAFVRMDIIFKSEPSDEILDRKMNSIKKIVADSNFSESEKRQVYRDMVSSVIKPEESQEILD